MNVEISKTLDIFGFEKEVLKQKSERYRNFDMEIIIAQSLKDIFTYGSDVAETKRLARCNRKETVKLALC